MAMAAEGSDSPNTKVDNEGVARERLKALFEGSLDAVYVLECIRDQAGQVVDFRFVDVNGAAERQMSMTRDQLVPQSICELFPVNRTHGYFGKYKRVFETGVAVEGEFQIPGEYTAPGWYYHQVVPLSNGVAIINRDISESKRTETALRAALQEKETLLRELYHRTKNNMMVISSLLTLQQAGSKNPDVQEVLGELKNRVESMALVHRKLYESQTLSDVALHEYVRDLITQLIHSYQRNGQDITLALNLQPVHVNLDTASPLGLVLAEFVSNAFRHGFRDADSGTVSVKSWTDAGKHLHLVFRDDGRGVAPGFDVRKDGGLGSQTLFNLVEHQLRGHLTFASDGGVSWHINVPM